MHGYPHYLDLFLERASPPSSLGGFMMRALDVFTGPIEFERHVKPLYFMFIRAFHIRGDREAAHTVIGIYQRIRNVLGDA